MPEQHHQRLCARVDAQCCWLNANVATGAHQVPGRELAQRGFGHAQHQAGVAPDHRVTDLVALPLIEEQHVVGVGHRLVAAHVAQVHAAIRKHEVRVRGALFSAAMTAGAAAIHTTHRHQPGVEQAIHREFLSRRVEGIGPRGHAEEYEPR